MKRKVTGQGINYLSNRAAQFSSHLYAHDCRSSFMRTAKFLVKPRNDKQQCPQQYATPKIDWIRFYVYLRLLFLWVRKKKKVQVSNIRLLLTSIRGSPTWNHKYQAVDIYGWRWRRLQLNWEQ